MYLFIKLNGNESKYTIYGRFTFSSLAKECLEKHHPLKKS